MPDVHTARRTRFAARFVALQACGMLITRPVNVYYLTGLACPHAALLVTALDATVLATHPACLPSARRHSPEVEVMADERSAEALVRLAVSLRLRRIAVEDQHLTAAQHNELATVAETAVLVPLGDAVTEAQQAERVEDEYRSLLSGALCGVGSDQSFSTGA